MAECADVLAGRALDVYRANRSPAPAWAQLNWLAHCEPSAVIDRSRSETGLRRRPGTWDWAVSALVHEVVTSAGGSPERIRRLQRDCVIPMECALLRDDAGCFLPQHLVALGVPRVRAHPAT